MKLSRTVRLTAAAGALVGVVAGVVTGLTFEKADVSALDIFLVTLLFGVPSAAVLGAGLGLVWQRFLSLPRRPRR